jgi:tyrosinase
LFCFFQASGQQIPLDEVNGINILGNMMEASATLSPNGAFYGDLHNTCHVFIALSHDPDHRHLESFGVMGDSATAMRDPVFYRWHAQVDDMFQQHKIKLTPYTDQQLTFPDITVDGVAVNTTGAPANTFSTFWQQSDVDFSRGLDFSLSKGNVFARFTHLNHAPFSYSIQVSNNGAARQGMVRVFLAPTTDERGQAMLLQDQRLLMIELDKFVAVCE